MLHYYYLREMQDEKNQVSKKIHEPVFNDALNHGLLRCKIENGRYTVCTVKNSQKNITFSYRFLVFKDKALFQLLNSATNRP